MSALLAHARAYQALGDALTAEAEEASDEQTSILLFRLSNAHFVAAVALEARAKAEASGSGCFVEAKPSGARRGR